MENRHKYFQRQRENIRTCRMSLLTAPTSITLRVTNPMVRYYSLSAEENWTKNNHSGSPPEQEE